MTSRNTLIPQAAKSRNSLLEALRAPGDNTALIAQRARKLLQWKPAKADRAAWLQELLPEEWHYTKTVAALQGAASSSNGSSSVATTSASGRRPPRHRHAR